MKSWIKISLAALAGAAIWGGLFLEQHLAEKEEASKKVETRLLDFDSKDVRKITLDSKFGRFVFQRETNTADWKMVEPQGAKPDQDAINNFVSSVQSTDYEQHMEDVSKAVSDFKAGKSEPVKDYGFEKPRASVVLDVAENKETGKKARELKFWLGGNVGIGSGAGAAFNALSIYGISTDRKGLLAVSSTFASTLEKGLRDFRSRVIGDFVASDVTSFELTKNDGTQLELNKTKVNDQNVWMVAKPKNIKADNNQVGLYLDSFIRLRADRVTEASSINEQNRASLGLAQPNATLVLKGENGKVLQTIAMGLTTDALYLTMSDGAAGSVELTKFAELAPQLKFFRDRRVLVGVNFNDINTLKTQSGKTYQKEGVSWYQVGEQVPQDPKKTEKVSVDDARKFVEDWEFTTAEDVLDADETSDLTKFGLDKPLTRFTLASTDTSKPQLELLVGNRVPNNEKSVYVKRADKPEVFLMETKWLDVLTRLDQGGQSPQAKK